MGKYLVHGSYTTEGLRGLVKDGGTKRRELVGKAIASVGGSMESMYYAFGDSDVYLVVDAPDNVTAAGLSLAVSATGAIKISVVVLLTPEEIDAAVALSPDYAAPGA